MTDATTTERSRKMGSIDYGRAAKYFLLADFIKGFGLGLKYFFAQPIPAHRVAL